MHAGLVLRIEKSLDRGASAIFAGACGYAAFVGLGARVHQPSLAALATGAGAFAYLVSLGALNRVQPNARKMRVPIFDVREIEPFNPPELLLTDRHEPRKADEEPLLLDDLLAEIGPQSRVVRLFDAAAMPTPGQLDARIRDRLEGGSNPPEPQDASQALHEALAELRQSLR